MKKDNTHKPAYGRLVWKKDSGEVIVIKEGPWGLLNYLRSQIKGDPSYSGGKLKITY